MRLVRVPLRISFVGGGSDLPSHYQRHGGAVVSATINKYIYITAKPNVSLFPHKYRLVYSQVEECNSIAEIKHPIIRECLLTNPLELSSLDLDVMSDVPAGTGLGSSSAFTVGMLKALAANYFADRYDLAERACEIEIDRLKEPIGKQDQYAAAFGGLNRFEFGLDKTTVHPIILSKREQEELLNSLYLIYVGGNRSAGKQLKEQFSGDRVKRQILLSAQANDALHCYYALKEGDIAYVGRCIRQSWELKKQLSPNISTPEIDKIIDTAIIHGAAGGKLLGAGGAGFVLLFCSRENRDTMLNGLKPLNPTYVPFKFDLGGARVLYES